MKGIRRFLAREGVAKRSRRDGSERSDPSLSPGELTATWRTLRSALAPADYGRARKRRHSIKYAFNCLNIPLAASPRANWRSVFYCRRILYGRELNGSAPASGESMPPKLSDHFRESTAAIRDRELLRPRGSFVRNATCEFIDARAPSFVRNATRRIDAFAMHPTADFIRAGPRPFRSPVDRFSAGSTTPALVVLSNPSSLASFAHGARRRKERCTFGDDHSPAIFID